MSIFLAKKIIRLIAKISCSSNLNSMTIKTEKQICLGYFRCLSILCTFKFSIKLFTEFNNFFQFQMNISHSEYTEKYNLYLDIIRRREQMEQQIDLTDPMYSMSAKKLFVFSHASM